MSEESKFKDDWFSEESVLETEVNDTGKNKNKLRCLRCSSLILKPEFGALKEIRFELPSMRKKRDPSAVEGEPEALTKFWVVEDMFSFENIGFSHTVDNIKYLACADCEVGPIGWCDPETKHSHVALNRVMYEPA